MSTLHTMTKAELIKEVERQIDAILAIIDEIKGREEEMTEEE